MACSQVHQWRSAITFTILSILGIIGILVVVGLDLLQAYETNWIMGSFIAFCLMFGGFGLAAMVTWILYCRPLCRRDEYETI